ncbi:glucose PTS transporter subunit IIA [Lachnospiraceae bacterium 54-53]
MDNKQIAETLISLSGGEENISSVTHCSTRLRFFIHDKDKVDAEQIKKTKPVLGVVFQGDELQMVLGKHVIPVYSEASKLYEGAAHGSGNKAEKNKKKENVLSRVIGFVSASVTPLIPGLVGGGMMKVFLLLATLAYAPFQDTQTYTLLSMMANVPFYFMPIFVAYGATKKLGATPLYAMSVVGALVYPDFISLVGAGDPVSIFGLPVTLVKYSSTLLPALLISIFAYYCEKILTKIIPGIIRTVLVGMCTMAISYVAGVTLLGPLGDLVGNYVVNIFLWSSEHFGPVAIGLLAACMPWLVMTGMHHAVTPFMVQAIADPGYDVFFRPAYLLHNMAEGGACLGVGLRSKDKAFKAECFSVAFGCIVAGVTEPAIYGINLRLKRPMIGVMAGAAAGGVVAGLMGATAYVYGYSTVLAIPIFQDTIMAIVTAIIVAIIVAAAVTFILGFEDNTAEPAEDKMKNDPDAHRASEIKDTAIAAVADARVFPLEEVKDEVFSQKMMGDGVAFELKDDLVCAPVGGELTALFPTGHAFGIRRDDGVEVLVHIGIDTVKLAGKGFTAVAEQGKRIGAGEPVVKVDRDMIQSEGYDLATILIITNANGKDIRFGNMSDVKRGDNIGEII